MSFNPSAHLIILKGRGGPTEYLPVAARIAWFRAEHPDGHIAVEAHTISDQIAIFHARVSVPEGGSAEGWGSETPRDFGDFIEKASTKALGRALLALGYGTLQAGHELDEGERLADAPIAVPAPVPLRAEQEGVIAQAWALAQGGDSYNATKAVVLTLKADAAPDEWREINRRWNAIRREHYPMTIAARETPAAS